MPSNDGIGVLTCKNTSCPTPHAGIRLHGPDLTTSHRTRHPEELPGELAGRQVLDHSEESVGRLLEIHAGADGGLWGIVRTGRVRARARFVPLQQASMDGEHIVVPIDGARIRRAPQLPDGELSPDDERRLLEHYHLGPVPGP